MIRAPRWADNRPMHKMNRSSHPLSFHGTLFVVLGIWALACGLTTRASGQSAAPPIRLGIIDEDQEFSKIIDLLTVEFSSKSGLEVLERTQIEKLYREQQLSASNGGYIHLGEVIGADGLLFFEKQQEGSDAYMRVRLVAVKPGIVLRDTRAPWPISDAQGWVKWAANHFAPFLRKLSVSAKAAVPISILNIRPESRSLDAKEYARQLTVLVTEQLTREREVFVLERRQMSAVLGEKDLKGAGESSFWSGKYLFEGTIESNAVSNEIVTINVRLIANSGSFHLIKVQGERSNPAGISEQLTKAVMDKVKLSASIRPWSPAEESEAYFKEGSEAYLWGMAGEAKAAADAAWALGKRTKDVAALRLCAYGSDIVPRHLGGNWEIPQVPPNASLDRSIRVLTLFLRDVHFGMTSSNTLSEQWFYIGGYKVLAPATAVLDSYFHAAEMRPGNESQLKELRALARQTVAILATYTPPNRPADLVGRSPKGNDRVAYRIWSETAARWMSGKTLWELGWLEGGVWYDKPEDALPMLRQVLEAGYRPEYLPRVIAWSWEDRKRAPGLLKQFVTSMSAHTNPAVRIEGLCLGVMQAPFDAERRDARCVEQLAAAMWAERELVWSTPANASVLRRTESELEQKYFVWTAPIVVEPFAGFKQKFRLEYLQSARTYDPQVFREMFPFSSTFCTPAEARQLIPAFLAFEQRLKGSTARIPSDEIVKSLERLSGTSSASTRNGMEGNTK